MFTLLEQMVFIENMFNKGKRKVNLLNSKSIARYQSFRVTFIGLNGLTSKLINIAITITKSDFFPKINNNIAKEDFPQEAFIFSAISITLFCD